VPEENGNNLAVYSQGPLAGLVGKILMCLGREEMRQSAERKESYCTTHLKAGDRAHGRAWFYPLLQKITFITVPSGHTRHFSSSFPTFPTSQCVFSTREDSDNQSEIPFLQLDDITVFHIYLSGVCLGFFFFFWWYWGLNLGSHT
jgi:hypothetical protein